MVALLTSVRNSPCFGGLRRTKTCHRQLFARPSVLFGYFLHDAKSDNPFPSQGESRFCKPRFSSPQWRLRTSPIKSFCRHCLLETWSPCSRPFAILPVSAVSDAQKLATGNFLHVRAAFSRRQSRLSRPRRLPQARHNRRSFHQALPEQPCKPPDSCLAPRHESPARHTAKANPDTGQKHCRWQSPRD